MKLHSNTLTWRTVHDALSASQRAGHVAEHVGFEQMDECGSRSRKVGFEIQLGTDVKLPGDKRRWKNSGAYGASDVYAATRDEWGWFIAELYAIDENAIFGPYKCYDDFLIQTKFAYDI